MNSFDIYSIPQECVTQVCTRGSNDEMVSLWFDILKLDADINRDEAEAYCRQSADIHPSETKTDREWKEMAFWLMCWNLFDGWGEDE